MTATLTIHADDTMTIDGQPITADRVAAVFASTEGEPELLVLDAYDGTGETLLRQALPLLPEEEGFDRDLWHRIDLLQCETAVETAGFTLVRSVHDGSIGQPGAWAATKDGHVATAVRGPLSRGEWLDALDEETANHETASDAVSFACSAGTFGGLSLDTKSEYWDDERLVIVSTDGWTARWDRSQGWI